jgi:hypothetical protein
MSFSCFYFRNFKLQDNDAREKNPHAVDKLNYPGKAGGLLGESLSGADKNLNHLQARASLLPPFRGKVGMGVIISIVCMLSFYPLPNPPPARGRE